jgi:hypothetical protein
MEMKIYAGCTVEGVVLLSVMMIVSAINLDSMSIGVSMGYSLTRMNVRWSVEDTVLWRKHLYLNGSHAGGAGQL